MAGQRYRGSHALELSKVTVSVHRLPNMNAAVRKNAGELTERLLASRSVRDDAATPLAWLNATLLPRLVSQWSSNPLIFRGHCPVKRFRNQTRCNHDAYSRNVDDSSEGGLRGLWQCPYKVADQLGLLK